MTGGLDAGGAAAAIAAAASAICFSVLTTGGGAGPVGSTLTAGGGATVVIGTYGFFAVAATGVEAGEAFWTSAGGTDSGRLSRDSHQPATAATAIAATSHGKMLGFRLRLIGGVASVGAVPTWRCRSDFFSASRIRDMNSRYGIASTHAALALGMF